MVDVCPIHPGQILIGPLFNEPMRVETVRPNGSDTWVAGLVGLQTERFRSVTLTMHDIKGLRIIDAAYSFNGDGQLLKLGLQAYTLGIAYEFDPYFGLSISRVDPLPHQLEAIYDHLLKLARVRFLLADDAGAGKTIMAGLLIRELKLRGLAERILVICPSNLTFQWERELKDKFDERFKRIKGADLDSYSMNQWLENKQVITSLDLAKRAQVLPGLRQVQWDLVIIDEAHRMSASDPEHKTLRYRLGELLRDTSDHILLLTATPHRGDPVNFSFFLQLLDEDAYAEQSARAAAQGDDPRARAVGFLMSLYQRRLASSTYAMRRSLENRVKRLQEGLRRAQELLRSAPPELPDTEELEEMEEAERERLESLLEAMTIAQNSHEIQEEIENLNRLAKQAKEVEDSGIESKLYHLREVLQKEGFFGEQDKRLLIFTEFRDTLEYLVENLREWGFRVGYIHRGMKPGRVREDTPSYGDKS